MECNFWTMQILILDKEFKLERECWYNYPSVKFSKNEYNHRDHYENNFTENEDLTECNILNYELWTESALS